MKARLSLSVHQDTADYLMSRARREADGNVSALVDTLVQKVRLEESVRVEAAWYTAHPGFEEAAEAERYGDA